MKRIADELDCIDYFITSAKEGWEIDELREAIYQAIDWSAMAKVVSNKLFQDIKQFLVKEKESSSVVSRVDDLYRLYLRLNAEQKKDIRAEFETCIGRIESQGLIKRLKFGDLILLQPELIDYYAAALINAAKDEPDEMGSIIEEKIKVGDFFIPSEEKIENKHDEQLLLLAMIEDLLSHEIAYRELINNEIYLVFPSQITKEHPELPDPKNKAGSFSFDGAIQNIYTILIVRLMRSRTFIKKEIWKNAAVYTCDAPGEYGILLSEKDDAHAELTLFHSETVDPLRSADFKKFVKDLLERRALPGSVKYRSINKCKTYNKEIPDQLLQTAKDLNLTEINCPFCGEKLSLDDKDKPVSVQSTTIVAEMNRSADEARDKAVAITITDGKKAVKAYDLLFSYSRVDREFIKEIVHLLKEHEILPWFDVDESTPYPDEEQVANIKIVAVFIGQNNIIDKQQEDLLKRFVDSKKAVLLILLPSYKKVSPLPYFLQTNKDIDLRYNKSDPAQILNMDMSSRKHLQENATSLESMLNKVESVIYQFKSTIKIIDRQLTNKEILST